MERGAFYLDSAYTKAPGISVYAARPQPAKFLACLPNFPACRPDHFADWRLCTGGSARLFRPSQHSRLASRHPPGGALGRAAAASSRLPLAGYILESGTSRHLLSSTDPSVRTSAGRFLPRDLRRYGAGRVPPAATASDPDRQMSPQPRLGSQELSQEPGVWRGGFNDWTVSYHISQAFTYQIGDPNLMVHGLNHPSGV